MKWILMLFATACFAQQRLAPEVIKLAAIRRHMLGVTERITGLTCLETIDRLRVNPKGKRERTDRVQVEVAYSNGEELFAWPGDDQFSRQHISAMLGGGMAGSGDFAGHLRSVFRAPGATIRFAAREGGLLRYDYSIPRFGSGYSVGIGQRMEVVPTSGSLWADENTLDVVRLHVKADDVPPTTGVSAANQSILYARVRLRNESVLLPQRSELVLSEFDQSYSRNQVEFSHCRSFGAESSVAFGESKPGADPVKAFEKISLPAGLQLAIVLQADVDLASAHVGDPIQGRVKGAVQRKGKLMVPDVAQVTGRIRWMEARETTRMLGLEFTEIRWDNTRARFLGRFDSHSDASGQLKTPMMRERSTTVIGREGFGVLGTIERLQSEETIEWLSLPGVAILSMPLSATTLHSGVETRWTTEEPARAR